ncbi:polysaccharide biosynthesis/export family protein [Acinetobacter sp.]|uniref:polysaccharide biosynthesis/export family protein n=1 Tax=Acinetobacter sp. TaxID=472 RepID=UPI002647A32C|nr:polysaccharide biosynthesis/export family protein [Acinetobacter sp.]MDN5512760.1 polysaccharide biosynthesis/export family protein [Acinetobacter sp.]MDN5526013.1 polysaccharide biosynthesis/export family protein [Acinetobacter sp.]
MRKIQYTALLVLSCSITSCTITSGLQTYDLPNEGVYQTDLGTQVNVIKLTQESLFAVQPAEINLRQDYAHLFSYSTKHYKLSTGDILSIYLWAYPEISGESADPKNGYQIDQNGYIQFPMIGRYKAAGKSLTQVNQELRNQLSRYLKTPDVIARVLSYQGQRFSVQGNVTKGGQFALSDQPISVYAALGMAGGVNSQQGDNTSITLVRQGRTYQLNSIELEKAGLSLHNLLIQPNDTLYVNSRENQKIYVMGESGKNQSLQMRDQGMSLSDVLGESLGLNPLSASRSKIYVVRSNAVDTSTEVYQLDLTSIADFGLANKFKMRSNDIVYVDASGLARWQRVVNQIIPFSNALYNLDRLGQ